MEVFELKDWPLNTGDIATNSIFDAFCEMLQYYNDEQRELILRLTTDFLYLRSNRYLDQINGILSSIDLSINDDSRKIYVQPLKNPVTTPESKSSDFMTDQFYDQLVRRHEFFLNRKLNISHTPEALPRNFNRKSALLFLVDDFIGTGETAAGAIDYFVEEKDISPGKIIVVVLVAQEIGLATVRNKGVSVFAASIRNRGITDNFQDPIKQRYLQLMYQIEKIIGVEPGFSLGYGQSEALVALHKTPNDTFPVFWLEVKGDRCAYDPPFKQC